MVLRRSNSFRRSPDHLWSYRLRRRRQGQTFTHDSRDDLLQSRAVRTTRSTGWSNSTSRQFVRFAPCDLGVAAECCPAPCSSAALLQSRCSIQVPGAPSRLHCERTGSNLENLSATSTAPCAALQLLGGRRERQTKCASVKCFGVKLVGTRVTPLYGYVFGVRHDARR